MKKNKLVVPAILILVLAGLFAMANSNHWFAAGTNKKKELPDAKEELKNIYMAYNDHGASFTMKGIVRVYDREENDSLKEETPLLYSKQGTEFYSQIGYMQTFFDGDLFLQLDTMNKYIIVSKVEKQSTPVIPSAFPLEQFMQDTSTFKIEAVVAGTDKERVMTIKNELNPEIKSTKIFYDPATYLIKRAEIEWWKGTDYNNEDENKTWLTVLEYSYPAARVMPVEEQIKKIIIWKSDKIEASPGYQNYEVRQNF